MVKEFGNDGGCVIIFDSIGECLSTYSALCEKLGGNERVGLVIGAVDKESRKIELSKPIVVGNNAIRVGIDFVKKNAIVYAFSAFDALQGIGRVGRGKAKEASTAILLVPPETAKILNSNRDKLLQVFGRELTRDNLTQILLTPNIFPAYEDFTEYLNYFGPLEALLAEEETWSPRCKVDLVENLFGIPKLKLGPSLEKIKSYNCIKNIFMAFRGDTLLKIAIRDHLMEKQGYFPFRLEDPYRVFRHWKIYPSKRFNKDIFTDLDQKWQQSCKRFLEDLEESKDYVLGYAEIDWRSNPRKGVYLQCREPNVWQFRDRLCWEFCDGKQCFHWQFKVSTNDARVHKLREIVNKHLEEHMIPFIVFQPSALSPPLPPLFYNYPIYGQSNLGVAFGGNALLLSTVLDKDRIADLPL